MKVSIHKIRQQWKAAKKDFGPKWSISNPRISRD